MSKSIGSKLDAARKFLERNAKSNLNLKMAQAALTEAEKACAELAALKARLSDGAESRRSSLLALDEAMARVKTEKKLKAKEAKVQAKLASLASPQGAAK